MKHTIVKGLAATVMALCLIIMSKILGFEAAVLTALALIYIQMSTKD